MSAAVIAQLCGFDHYSGVPETHECVWLRGRSTVEFAVPRASDGGPGPWVMASHYVIVPCTSEAYATEVAKRFNGQGFLFGAVE